jgi:hypothetical protein
VNIQRSGTAKRWDASATDATAELIRQPSGEVFNVAARHGNPEQPREYEFDQRAMVTMVEFEPTVQGSNAAFQSAEFGASSLFSLCRDTLF